jgi:hypothetical protein
MSKTDSANVDRVDGATDYLKRNADVVDIHAQRESGSESWDRAKDAGDDAGVDDLDPLGRYVVELPDGNMAHDTMLVADLDGNFIGACDCDGWIMHGTACAHLCTLAQRDILSNPSIPQSNQLAKSLLELRDDDPDGVGADVVEEPTDEPSEGAETYQDNSDEQPKPAKPVETGDSNPNAPVEPQGSDGENSLADPDSDPFAGKLPNVPDHLVMEMDGQPYIRRGGYARLAKSEGLRLGLEEIVGAHENDWTRAKYQATVRDGSGKIVATDVGSAHLEVEDMANAKANLDELAATRAACRALAWATGEGLTAVEEVAAEQATQVIDT